MSAHIARGLRCIVTGLLIYGAYTETGLWTALCLLGAYVGIELLSFTIGQSRVAESLFQAMRWNIKEKEKFIASLMADGKGGSHRMADTDPGDDNLIVDGVVRDVVRDHCHNRKGGGHRESE